MVYYQQLSLNETIPNKNEDWGSGGSGAQLGELVVNICGIFSLIASIISLFAMITHLKNYTKPHLQRFIIRIKWMIPVYALSSWISLVSLNAAFYIDAIRDIYEAFVIYCFFALMVNYMGGERAFLSKLYGRPPIKHMWPAYYFSREMEVGDPYSFLFLKRGILQYVYIKPIIAIITMILKYTNNYDESDLSLYSGYFYITFIYNISVCVSLYCLVFLFQTIKNDIKKYNPLAKFLCVKAIVFFSFWQGLVISALVSSGLVKLGNELSQEHTAVALQDALICIELLFGAIAHWFAFTYKDYQPSSGIVVRLKLYYAIRDAIGIKDIIRDSLETYSGAKFNYRTFEPAEGTPITDTGLNNRLKAGLRYSSGGQHKYWINDVANHPSTHLLREPTPDNNSRSHYGDLEILSFEPVINDMEAEELYKSSRKYVYGDYNIPTIENFIPYKRKMISKRISSNQRINQHYKRNSSPIMQPSKDDFVPNLKSNSAEAIIQTPNQTTIEPITDQEVDSPIETSTFNLRKSDSLVSSPWDSPSFKAKETWKDELKRLANREAESTSHNIGTLIDPWK